MLGRLSELLSHQCINFRITSLAYTGNQKSSKHSSDSNSKVPKPQLLGASFPGCNLKELEMALPMCICDVAEQTGHERNYRARLEPKRALEAPRTSEVSQSQSRTEEDVCIIKRPLTGSNLFSFSSCFDYKISSLSISERVQGRSRPHMFLLACSIGFLF